MTYQLTYIRDPRNLPPGQTYFEPVQTITWCAPSGWSDECVIRSFEQQFPGAVVLSLAPKTEVAA